MKAAVIITTPDFAGLNIKENLLENYKFKKTTDIFEDSEIYELKNDFNEIKIYTTDTRCVDCEDYDKKVKGDIFIFPTTHRSEKGVPSLSVHAPGNWGSAGLGGKPKTLCPCDADFIKTAYLKLKELAGNQYNVTLECTHHGPYNEKPVVFLEIGCSEKEWKDRKAGKIIADVLMFALSNKMNHAGKEKTAVGLGGPHYCPTLVKVIERSEYALGHICPAYNLENLDDAMLKQAMEKSDAGVIIADWKGLKQFKEKVKDLAERNKIALKKTKEFSSE